MSRVDRPLSPAARPVHALVRAYRRIGAGRPSPCRFDPSCSAYALDALETHGAWRGLWLTAGRIGRCHPWGGHGYDPVPAPHRHSTETPAREATECST